MIVEGFNQSGIVAKVCMLVPIVPLVFALAYAIRPTERRLALMRPLSLAAIFAAVAGLTVGFAVVLQGLAATQIDNVDWNAVAMGASETFVPVFSGFACLTLSWLLVAIGMRRQP